MGGCCATHAPKFCTRHRRTQLLTRAGFFCTMAVPTGRRLLPLTVLQAALLLRVGLCALCRSVPATWTPFYTLPPVLFSSLPSSAFLRGCTRLLLRPLPYRLYSCARTHCCHCWAAHFRLLVLFLWRVVNLACLRLDMGREPHYPPYGHGSVPGQFHCSEPSFTVLWIMCWITHCSTHHTSPPVVACTLIFTHLEDISALPSGLIWPWTVPPYRRRAGARSLPAVPAACPAPTTLPDTAPTALHYLRTPGTPQVEATCGHWLNNDSNSGDGLVKDIVELMIEFNVAIRMSSLPWIWTPTTSLYSNITYPHYHIPLPATKFQVLAQWAKPFIHFYCRHTFASRAQSLYLFNMEACADSIHLLPEALVNGGRRWLAGGRRTGGI